MKLLLGLMILALMGCGNQVEVPANVNAQLSGTATVNVTHSITIAADLLGVFKDACEQDANHLGLQVGSVEREAYVQACLTQKENDLLAALIGAMNNITPPSQP